MSQGHVAGRSRMLSKAVAGILIAAPLGLGTPVWAQQLTPDEAGAILLNSARTAYNEGNYPVAMDRFRTCLQKNPARPFAVAARFGLAAALLEGPNVDYAAALEMLQPVAGQVELPDRAMAQYYLGLASRGVGLATLGQIAGKPNETQQLNSAAMQRFTQAAAAFAGAVQDFASLAKNSPAADAKELPVEWEWVARARCDQAEMLLRVGKFREAAAAIEPLLKDPALSKTRYRKQAIYTQGYASYMLKDHGAAVRSLAALVPFDDNAIGVHAQYLLARTHHLSDQPAEAAALYEAVQVGYQKQRKAAEEALKNPETLKNKPEERAQLQAMLNSPPPDYVARAGFYQGVLLYEQGKYAESLAKLTAFAKQSPQSPLAAEGRLRQGLCLAQLRQYKEAIDSLTPLQDHPQLGDQALRWLAKAQIGAADPTNLQAYDQAMKGAMEKLAKAAERLKAIVGNAQQAAVDPEAKARRGEVLLELGDAQRLARQYREAAATYQVIVNEKTAPDAVEEAMHGIATALQLAGLCKESDEACMRFQQSFPRSTLLPAIAFRHAENAYLAAAATMANPNSGMAKEEIKRLYSEAITRYQQVISKYPGYQHLSLAKQGMASAYYQLGQYDKAGEALNSIPGTDRSGPLASVNYILADCLLRTLPAAGDDALSTARRLQQLEQAAALLTEVMMTEGSPLVPDATIKLGYTLQQMAGMTADAEERQKQLQNARAGYTRFMLPLKDHPLYPLAVLENAKVTEQLGGFGAAVNLLNQFRNDPLRKSPLATLAMMRLAEGLRGQRKAAEAAALLAQWRQEKEAELLKDPARMEWVSDLQFGHGMALKDAGKYGEAQVIFENILKQFPKGEVAEEIPLRIAQCRREDAAARMEAAAKVVMGSPGKPEAIQAAKTSMAECAKSLTETAEMFLAQAEKLADKPERLEACVRMHYEAAWCYRGIAEVQIDTALDQMRDEAVKKFRASLPKDRAFAAMRPPEIPEAAVPIQPAEIKAREQYKIILNIGVDVPLVLDAQYELADLLTQRNEHKAAIPLLVAALQQEMTPDVADRIRLRLGACLVATGEGKAAAAQFDAILKTPRSPLIALARYGLGEALLVQKDWSRAVQTLLPFQDGDQYRHLPGTSDRALVRVGYAYAQLGQWEASRKAYEALVQRFPRSAWAVEGRYGIGWAFQNLKQYDNAIAAYTEVTQRSGAEIAARAQMQIGLCRMEQKRPQDAANALMAVAYTYDYPEVTAQALCEAAKAYLEQKQPEEARKALDQVLKDHPTGPWAEAAKKLQSEIK